MKYIFILFLLVNTCFAQTLIRRDDMESTSTWRGSSTTGINSSFVGGLSNAIDNPSSYPMYSSFDTCYQIRGAGLGSSAIEIDTFIYPNVLVPTGKQYQIRFKIASFGLNPSSQTAAGVDQPDWIEMQYTLNNGLSWWRDAQIQGISNSMWSFDGAIGTGAKLNITRTGSTSTATPTIYVSNASNPVVNVSVTIPFTTAPQIRIRFVTNINATGETFMLDDVEIWDLTTPLPVELIEFNGKYYNTGIKLYWATASETNNDHFEILKSFDGFNFIKLTSVKGKGNTSMFSNYEYIDYDVCDTIVYYKLLQVDYDGLTKEYDPIAFKCRQPKINDDFFDILGRKVRQDFDGIKIYQN
jgi:hypothetical protein